MNKINFATAPIKKKSSKNKTSFVFVISIASLVVFLQMKQWSVLKRIKKEKTDHTQLVAHMKKMTQEKNSLKEKQTDLKKRLAKVEKIKNNPHQYFSLFTTINNLLQGTGQLNTLDLTEKKINVSVLCADIKRARQFMHNISALPAVKNLELVSIAPADNQFLFTMNGKLT